MANYKTLLAIILIGICITCFAQACKTTAFGITATSPSKYKISNSNNYARNINTVRNKPLQDTSKNANKYYKEKLKYFNDIKSLLEKSTQKIDKLDDIDKVLDAISKLAENSVDISKRAKLLRDRLDSTELNNKIRYNQLSNMIYTYQVELQKVDKDKKEAEASQELQNKINDKIVLYCLLGIGFFVLLNLVVTWYFRRREQSYILTNAEK